MEDFYSRRETRTIMECTPEEDVAACLDLEPYDLLVLNIMASLRACGYYRYDKYLRRWTSPDIEDENALYQWCEIVESEETFLEMVEAYNCE